MKNLLILGGGTAGICATLAAARVADRTLFDHEVKITLISDKDYFTPRPRLYEDVLDFNQSLTDIITPVGVDLKCARVTAIKDDYVEMTSDGNDPEILQFDKLIIALGSTLSYPRINGIYENTFNIDNYTNAKKMREHLLNQDVDLPVIVVGAGFTGVELATQIASEGKFKVILVDKSDPIENNFGDFAASGIRDALDNLAINYLPFTEINEFSSQGILLSGGNFLRSHTIIYCGGVIPSPLVNDLASEKDQIGRIKLNKYLQSNNENIYLAGDCAVANTDPYGDNYVPNLMTCQHGAIMGLFAGYNAMSELVNNPQLVYNHVPYITCLDLGKHGALLTKGWKREAFSDSYLKPELIKIIKQNINRGLSFPIGNKQQVLEFMHPVSFSLNYVEYLKICQGL